ncbi:hypothetical protein [Daejeonella oryzae]|uniref:hypothetical protein n=1 Tax=Daejeonella oryzae TaxID=1122943 RepID=UPI000414E0EF|nr:hypothetical protein [Daejeonella oryzae]
MKKYKNPNRILLLLTISIFFSFCNADNSKRTDSKKQNQLERIDSTRIFQVVLDSFFIEGVKGQDVFIIVNNLIKPDYNLKVDSNPVKYINKPLGYPKGEKFDYSKLIVSFEKLKISGSNCTLTIYCKRAGIIADYVLIKVKGKWIIKSFNRIYT